MDKKLKFELSLVAGIFATIFALIGVIQFAVGETLLSILIKIALPAICVAATIVLMGIFLNIHSKVR